jgi:hypothetical protein
MWHFINFKCINQQLLWKELLGQYLTLKVDRYNVTWGENKNNYYSLFMCRINIPKANYKVRMTEESMTMAKTTKTTTIIISFIHRRL